MTEPNPSLDALRIDRDRMDGERPRRKVLVVVGLAVGLGITGFLLWRHQQAGVAVRTVTAVSAASGGGRIALNASGYVVARRAATVSSKITGKVAEVLIEEGMSIQQGDVLARLDDTNIRTAFNLAEAELASVRAVLAETMASLDQSAREFRRVEALSQTQIASEADLDKAQAAVLTLQARLERQRADINVAESAVAVRRQELEDTIIRAPFSGMVTAKNAQPGEMISPMSAGGGFTRTGIGTVVDMTSLEIEVDVNESYLQRVNADQQVEAVLDAYPDWNIPGHVIAIIPTADRQKATVKVRVGFAKLDPRILPEMGVKVAFLADASSASASQAVVVPRRALRKVDGRDVVLLAVDGQMVQRPVTLGVLRSDEATITEGLAPGDRVIVEGPEAVVPGAKVREIKP